MLQARKEKVLMVFQNGLEIGGVQNVIMQITRGLSSRYIFDIIVLDAGPSYYDEEFESYGGRIFRFGRYDQHSTFHARADYYLRALYMYRNVLHVLRQEGPYVAIHCHTGLESGICVLAGKRAGVPIRIAHTHISFENDGNILFRAYSRFYQYLIETNATLRLGCSAMALEKTFGSGEGMVIGNGVNLDLYSKQSHFNETEPTIRLLQVATLSQNKNQLFSLQVLNQLLKRGIPARLTLLGGVVSTDFSGYYSELQEYIKTQNLESQVQFLPRDSAVPVAMKYNMFLLFPSIREGFGIVLVEAQAAGLHCFVSDTVPHEVDCGGCTFLSLKDGPEAWAEVIHEKYLITHGKHEQYDCARFSAESICHKYLEIYEGKIR